MAGTLSVLLIGLPWLGALLVWLSGDARPKILHILAVGTSVSAGLLSLILLAFAGSQPAVNFKFGGWFGDFTLVADGLGATLAAVACVVGSLAVIYSVDYMQGEAQLRRYYAFILLFIGAMTGLVLSGHGGFKARVLDGWLALHGVREDACLMLVGAAGSSSRVSSALAESHALVRKHGGVVIGGIAGNKWYRTRFEFPYLRNSLWERGYGIDTLETAMPWGRVPQYITTVESAIRQAFETENEKIHIFTHLSHVYPHGTSAYTTYLFRLGDDPDALLARWGRAKTAAGDTIARFAGTISHQHGVGHDHRAWLPAEKGAVGMSMLRSAVRAVDPDGLFDTGNLLRGGGEEVGA